GRVERARRRAAANRNNREGRAVRLRSPRALALRASFGSTRGQQRSDGARLVAAQEPRTETRQRRPDPALGIVAQEPRTEAGHARRRPARRRRTSHGPRARSQGEAMNPQQVLPPGLAPELKMLAL